MALDFRKCVRLLIFAMLSTLVTSTWSKAQDPEDPRGLYESYGPLTRPSAPPKPGEFHRRTPKSTKSRFAPHFRRFMGESEEDNLGENPTDGLGRAGARSSSNFTDGFFDDEDESEHENQKGFLTTHSTSRFSEKERETRHDAYREYLKERDPAKRAQLYREYIGKNSQSPSAGNSSSLRDILNSSDPASSATAPPSFGLSRPGSTTNRALPSSTSSGPAAPRGSLFSSSGSKTQAPPGRLRRNDEPAPQKSTGSPSRRSTGSARQNQNLESDR
ncbi:hypothetical protein Sinac_3889 [Singulisphaera acidiphila DSM 18658]|uniref:Uncharacterized protein n=1 Tax=Singulisphaera acidiphila (strain ATCC BAA-1392 / DSM 18658 / VKM B-2454 / MOB10) TaxID=886293 RepID=L0DFT0_SINAD|nr:hypothetical protein Sinac_3889 [Singulisphaera acidiphila DSM 18658]